MNEELQLEAEGLYRSGRYNCAEAVFETIRRHYFSEEPESLTAAVAGFGGGSASGCICGAVSGGTVALGIAISNKREVSLLTKELHNWFKSNYGTTCCRLIRERHRGACAELTGLTAAKIAEYITSRKNGATA